jgi:hypothetical protein
MGELRVTNTHIRHREIYEKYLETLKELGDKAPGYSKIWIYDHVASKTMYSSGHCSRVIRRILKKGK